MYSVAKVIISRGSWRYFTIQGFTCTRISFIRVIDTILLISVRMLKSGIPLEIPNWRRHTWIANATISICIKIANATTFTNVGEVWSYNYHSKWQVEKGKKSIVAINWTVTEEVLLGHTENVLVHIEVNFWHTFVLHNLCDYKGNYFWW